MPELREVQLVKFGGSLITDKTRPQTARMEVIAGLAKDLQRALGGLALPVIIGHGSGSFGHVAAERSGIDRGISDPTQLPGVSDTQGKAHELHQIVVSAMRDAGVPTYSIAPSSCMVAAAGQPDKVWPDPVLAALRLGLVPTVFGDVVMDSERGASICSTESVFLALVPALGSRGVFVRRVVWLGQTDGILDRDGVTIPEISLIDLPATLEGLSGAAGTDVTGGIRHRLEAAGALAQLGVASWIGDGRRPNALVEGLEDTAKHGTHVIPGGTAAPLI